MTTLIANGTLLTPAGPLAAGLLIAGGTIAAIGDGLAGDETIDATGLLVLPGAVDPHVHLAMPAGELRPGVPLRSSDDWRTGTGAALHGGTTTVIDFVEPGGEGLLAALEAREAEARAGALTDFALHMTLVDARPETLAEIPAVVAAGVWSFKTYTTYAGFRLDDAQLLAAYEAVGKAGGLALVHAENDAVIAHRTAQLLAAGKTAPRWHPVSRPAAAEGEAVERAIALAEVAGCPLYVVHISTGRGAAAVARARARGQAVWGETCPQYLTLTDAEYDRPGFEGAKFVCSPPLRTQADVDALWEALARGDISTAGTDHCPFVYAGEKDRGDAAHPPPFNRIPGGMPGIEARLSLIYNEGVRSGRITLERWVDACCTAPARIFGLARKGSLEVGNDADIILFDPHREVTLSTGTLHERCDYTPYEGRRVTGWPVLTLRRGERVRG